MEKQLKNIWENWKNTWRIYEKIYQIIVLLFLHYSLHRSMESDTAPNWCSCKNPTPFKMQLLEITIPYLFEIVNISITMYVVDICLISLKISILFMISWILFCKKVYVYLCYILEHAFLYQRLKICIYYKLLSSFYFHLLNRID